MKHLYFLVFTIILGLAGILPAAAEVFKKIDKPPLSEHWFGIYVENNRVGFYHQKIEETPDGYRMEGNGNLRISVMGFSKISATHEIYLVGRNLSLRSLDVEQTINGISSRVYGKAGDGIMRIKSNNNGRTTEKQLKFNGDLYPGPALNLYPMMRDIATGKSYKMLTFDPEEIRIKEVIVRIIGDEKAYNGRLALKLRNNLYPFVNNDVWMDKLGNIISESVREGLVITKEEDPKSLGAYVSNLALGKKDLIYDFSMVRIEPPIKEQQKLKGMAVTIDGWNDSLPLFQGGGQVVKKTGPGRLTIRTGLTVPLTKTDPLAKTSGAFLKPDDKIEVDAPEIMSKAKELAAGKKSQEEVARTLTAWTANWLNDTIEDTGGALASFKSRKGNSQTHARLYTALARAAGIPTRFVSGLVCLEGKNFLYHSWAESLLGGHWVAIDPMYNQLPADPTHIKLFEGHLPEDTAPIISIIGKIRISVLETRY